MKKLSSLFTWLIVLTGLAAGITSCGSSVAETEYEIDGDCWSSRDTVFLQFDNPDTSSIYRLYFPITFTESYSYNNFYLHALVVSPSGDENLLPARFDLMDKQGNWYSEPSGDEIPFKLTVEDGLRFNQMGSYRVKLFHYMRDEPLCGVRSAGIVLDAVSD